MTSQDFLHEYVEEVKEHLQELENSLLAMEREGTNREEISQIFRAAHSIKGASAYMGFEQLAGLTHELESLISAIQAESRPVPQRGMSVLLECVDFISNAIRLIQETGEEPPLPTSLIENLQSVFSAEEGPATESRPAEIPTERPAEEPPELEVSFEEISEPTFPEVPFEPTAVLVATPPTEVGMIEEEDRELYNIFIKTFVERLAEFSSILEGPGEKLPDKDFELGRDIIKRLISSSQYMDYDSLVDVLSAWEKAHVNARGDGAGADRRAVRDLFDTHGRILKNMLPGLEIPSEGGEGAAEEPPVEERSLLDDDEELFAIFSDSFRQVFRELAARISTPSDALLSDSEYDSSRELMERLISSSQYMDFDEVIGILGEWDEALQECRRKDELTARAFHEHLNTYGLRLQSKVPELSLFESMPTGPQEDQRAPEKPAEEDEELFGIFLESFQQLFADLVGFFPAESDGVLSEAEYDRYQEILKRMISSSQYMDYEQIVTELNEWDQTVRNLHALGSADGPALSKIAQERAQRLMQLLPGLSMPEATFPQSVEEGPEIRIEDQIDATFDQIERFATPEDLLTDDLTPEEILPQAKSPTAPGKVEKEVAPPSASPDKKAGKSGRVVAVTEELSAAATLRVDALKVDQLLNQVGELVVTRSEFIQTSLFFRDMIREIAGQGKLSKQEIRKLRNMSFRLNESTISLGRVANDLQDSVMRIRMLPISFLFQRFPRVVRDQSLKLGKKVDLTVEGGETEIDKRVLEQMNDPLVQFLRNAIAHGIETPTERRLASKPETGTIRLSAFHQGDYVSLLIEDDGRGIDTKKLRSVLKERKELGAHEIDRLSDQEVMYAIFLPGVSTHDRVDGTAGRGVGLDVVKENVERMNGSIEVESFPGIGTRFIIRIPLTVAIIRALLVFGKSQVFTIPLSAVSEILRYRHSDTHTIEGFQVISLRGKTIPLVHLSKLLGMGASPMEDANKSIVIVSTSFREVGLVVDGLVGEREVVIKPLEDGTHNFEGFSGATILGDGTVSLILDVSSLLRIMKEAFGDVQAPMAQASHLH